MDKEQEDVNKQLSAESKEYINKNREIWKSAPGMSITDILTLINGTEEEILEMLKRKSEEDKVKQQLNEETAADHKLQQCMGKEGEYSLAEQMKPLQDKVSDLYNRWADAISISQPKWIAETAKEYTKQPPKSFSGTAEEYIKYVERIKKEGLNADQEDKSPAEEYVDAIAENRILKEYEEWVNPQPVEIDWEKSCKAVMIEKMNVEQKILQWYTKTKDESFREYMDIQVKREGKID